MTKYREDISKQFRYKRFELGLTSEQVADKAGISRPTYSKIENCNYDGIRYVTIERVASALGLEIKLILRGR